MSIPLTEPETDLNEEPAYLQEVLGSRCFDRADTQKKVLIYLWGLRGKDVSEYGIATEALGRRPDFDPKIDASVRVQVSRLRKKLKEFYETEGRNSAYHLQIPIGSHSLEVVEQSHPTPVIQSAPERVSWREPRWAFITLSVLCLLFAALSFWFWYSNKRTTQSHDSRGALNQPLPFWKQFLGTSSRSQIVLPTPVFVKFSGNRPLRVRDIDVNDFQQWRSSPDLVAISKYAGEPRLEQGYTVASDTFAAIRLARYLDSVGLGNSLTFSNSSDASMSDLESSSEIVLGSHGTLHAFQPFLDKMSFVLTENEGSVEERTPNRSPHEIFRAVDEGAGRTIEPGLIAFLPGKDGRTQLLILQSRRTAALVEMMTSATGAEMIEQLRRKKGSPRFFEVVVLAEMNGDHMIRAWPLDLAPIDPARFGS